MSISHIAISGYGIITSFKNLTEKQIVQMQEKTFKN